MVERLRSYGVLLVGVALTLATTAGFLVFEKASLHKRFDAACDDRVHAVSREVDTDVRLLLAVEAFARANPTAGWQVLHEFVDSFSLLSSDVVRCYWWNPAVSSRVVQPLDAYPEDSSRVALSVREVRELIRRSGRSEKPAAMILGGRGPDEKPVVVVAAAVSQPWSTPEAGQQGVVIAFEPAGMIRDALSVMQPLGIRLDVADRSLLLYRSEPKPALRLPLRRFLLQTDKESLYQAGVPVGDAEWSVQCGRLRHLSHSATWRAPGAWRASGCCSRHSCTQRSRGNGGRQRGVSTKPAAGCLPSAKASCWPRNRCGEVSRASFAPIPTRRWA